MKTSTLPPRCGLAVLFSVLWLGHRRVFSTRPCCGCSARRTTLLPLAQDYLLPIKFTVPFFLFNQMLAAFLRNDGSPGLATAGRAGWRYLQCLRRLVCSYFACDMGIFGAGLATAIGAGITFCVMLTPLFSRRMNTLRLVRPKRILLRDRSKSLVTGFSTFFIDVAMGILTMLFNRQIMRYIGTDALAVYGVIVNISTFVQCCAYSVGQAAQPILSRQPRRRPWRRIRQTLRYALYAMAFFSVFWTALVLAVPNGLRPRLHVPDRERARRRARHHAQLWPLVPAAAA